MKVIKIYIILVALVFLSIGASISYYCIVSTLNNQKVNDAQIQYYNALKEQIGKPQIIQNEYRYPGK